MKQLLLKTLKDYEDFKLDKMFDKNHLIVTSNPEIYMNALDNKNIYNMLMDKRTSVIPDGVSVSYALKKVFKKNVNVTPGVELLVNILDYANKNKKSIFLYGAKKEVNEKFKNYVKTNFNNIKILDNIDGYLEEKKVKEKVIKTKPDIVVAALGVPKQELFLYDVLNNLNKSLCIGVGGSFDVLSGSVKRAPKLIRKLKIEWLYRIIKEPKRLKRFMKYNVKFIKKVRKCDRND